MPQQRLTGPQQIRWGAHTTPSKPTSLPGHRVGLWAHRWRRDRITDKFQDKITELVKRSGGRLRSDKGPERLIKLANQRSQRSIRRAASEANQLQERARKPGRPAVAGARTVLIIAWVTDPVEPTSIRARPAHAQDRSPSHCRSDSSPFSPNPDKRGIDPVEPGGFWRGSDRVERKSVSAVATSRHTKCLPRSRGRQWAVPIGR